MAKLKKNDNNQQKIERTLKARNKKILDNRHKILELEKKLEESQMLVEAEKQRA